MYAIRSYYALNTNARRRMSEPEPDWEGDDRGVLVGLGVEGSVDERGDAPHGEAGHRELRGVHQVEPGEQLPGGEADHSYNFV